jgi:hypothetical protein
VVYNDFRDAAIEVNFIMNKGVKLISEKQLLPINYTSMDNISKGLYIYDNIFLSILEDSNNFQVWLSIYNHRHITTMQMPKLSLVVTLTSVISIIFSETSTSKI